MNDEPTIRVVIGTPLDNALSKLRWAAEGEFSAPISPTEARTLLAHYEEREKFTLPDGPDEEPEPEEPTYTTGTGQVLHKIHDPADCEGRACVIHNPSPHYMADFPTHWREDRGIMERICSHGVGHPDPDDMAYIRLARGDEAASVEGVHGCDGCCTPKAMRDPHLRGNE